jgi:hypothetical protein
MMVSGEWSCLDEMAIDYYEIEQSMVCSNKKIIRRFDLELVQRFNGKVLNENTVLIFSLKIVRLRF